MVNRNGPWTKSTKLIIDKSNLGSGQGGEGEEEKEEGRGGGGRHPHAQPLLQFNIFSLFEYTYSP